MQDTRVLKTVVVYTKVRITLHVAFKKFNCCNNWIKRISLSTQKPIANKIFSTTSCYVNLNGLKSILWLNFDDVIFWRQFFASRVRRGKSKWLQNISSYYSPYFFFQMACRVYNVCSFYTHNKDEIVIKVIMFFPVVLLALSFQLEKLSALFLLIKIIKEVID